MGSINTVILVGNLGDDPDRRYTQSGKIVVNLRIATNDGWGQNKETNWHRVTVFGKRAEACADYLHKGAQVAVRGRISYRKWEKDDGTSQWFTDIIAEHVAFLRWRGSEGNSAQAQAKPQPKPKPQQYDDQGFAMNNTDIPF